MLKAYFSAPTGRQVFLFLFSFLFICQLLFLPSIPLPSFIRIQQGIGPELQQTLVWVVARMCSSHTHPLNKRRNQDQPQLSSQTHEQEQSKKKEGGYVVQSVPQSDIEILLSRFIRGIPGSVFSSVQLFSSFQVLKCSILTNQVK